MNKTLPLAETLLKQFAIWPKFSQKKYIQEQPVETNK